MTSASPRPAATSAGRGIGTVIQGAACDIESYIYFPLLEETGYMPVQRYSKAPEIREHCVRIAQKFDLYPRALFSTQVTSLDWDAEVARWMVVTDRGDRVRARFVVLTTGPLNRPKLPEIPGIETFAGHSFHTSRWDYDYTGGSATEPMDRLAGKRIGIIGTGATAIQCVPPLARSAGHLYVFQRTPSSVDARDNAPTDPQWVETLKPGWQRERMENFTAQFTAQLPPDDKVHDGWTVLARAVREKLGNNPQGLDPGTLLEQADFEKMAQIRDRIDAIVADPATADALKPWFSLYCKRPCFHDEYLQVFNRDNVTLVDTEGRGVERVTPTGLVVAGREYPLDCLIYATGFEVAGSYAKRSGMEIRGVRWAFADPEVGRRALDAARHAYARLPQLLHHQPSAVGHVAQLPAYAERADATPRAYRRRVRQAGCVDGRTHRQGGRVVGRDDRPASRIPPGVHRGVHTGLLQ